jgi:phosphoribosylformylglycinamidine cyclo-ligase
VVLTQRFTYSDAGVDRQTRADSKKALQVLKKTYGCSRFGEVVQLPYGNIFPLEDYYLDLSIEGVGTKVLIAQLAGKYSTIGIDGVAMVVNDVIRSGARPLAIADNIHAQVSDPTLVKEWMKGVVKGAVEAECVVPGGEIGDVPDLIKGLAKGSGFDMVFASVGEVAREKIIYGKNVRPRDTILGLRSSGVHSNGISLARKILFRKWGGKFEPHTVPDGMNREIVEEVLKPTKIYVKPLLRLAEDLDLKAAVHVTGDAYLKFNRIAEFSHGIGFEFDNFSPQPIFTLIQETASQLGGSIADEEMFKTFNMGWGFAVIVDRVYADRAMDVLNRNGTEAEEIGRVTGSQGVRLHYKNKKIILG